MNDHEQDLFETELRRMRPAELPEDFANRLLAARPEMPPPTAPAPSVRTRQRACWRGWVRWLAPVTAAAAAVAVLALWLSPRNARNGEPGRAALQPVFRADAVEIDRQLVGAFDAVATLPGGEPVRVVCREWVDEVVLRDQARGMAIENRTPRFEIIPVSFETF